MSTTGATPTSALPEDNWLNLLGDAGPTARLLKVLERLETAQANLAAADGGKSGLFRARNATTNTASAQTEQLTTLKAEITALREENQRLRQRQQQAVERLAALMPSLAVHLGEATRTEETASQLGEALFETLDTPHEAAA